MNISPPIYKVTMVFCDIVKFSQYTDRTQFDLINSLNADVARVLFPYLTGFGGPPSVICLPTGDGMVVVLIENRDIQLIFSLIKSLIEWTKPDEGQDRLPSSRRIRVGVHVGNVTIINDINRLPNVCGATTSRWSSRGTRAHRRRGAARPRRSPRRS